MKCEYPLNPLKDYKCLLPAEYFYSHKYDKQIYCCCKYHTCYDFNQWEQISKEEYLAYEILES